jgi:hypothetical protein
MGFLTIGETHIPVVDVHLGEGRITIVGRTISPFPGASGEPTLYGHDLQAILHMPQVVSIPPMLTPGLAVMFALPLAVDKLVMGDDDADG